MALANGLAITPPAVEVRRDHEVPVLLLEP
jgi:hypothetical protein